MLEHHADAMPKAAQLRVVEFRDAFALHPHLAGAGPLEQIQHSYQGAFARSGSADNTEHFALLDVQIHAGQGVRYTPRRMIDFMDVF